MYTYDSMGQLTSGQKYLADGTAIQGLSFGYDFDDIGNRKSTSVNNQTANYSPNSLNQYDQRDVPGVVDIVGSSSATEVKVDDVVTVRNADYYSSQVALANSVVVPYAIEVKEDNVVTETKSGYLRANPELFTYDDDGNLLTDGLWNYFWNGENRLIRMTSQVDDTELEFAYDYMGRRFKKRVLDAGILQYERRFLYDGYNCIAELDEHNTVLKTYLWGLDLSGSEQGAGGVGGLLAVTDKVADKTYYALSDGNGNVTGYVDSDDGSLVYSVEYSPFGKVLVENGDKVCDYGFSTKPLDSETGLNYYNYRYYNPETGRWTQQDPAGTEIGGLNLYGFVQNDGINNIDILGLWKIISPGIHEEISLSAMSAIDFPFPRSDKTNEILRNSMIFGSRAPDIPNGIAISALLQISSLVTGEYFERIFGNTEFYKTHYGENQYYHAMVNNETDAGAFRTKIINFIIQQVEKYRAGDCKDMRNLGIALHTIQDSFSASHVVRDANLKILQYQSYLEQDHAEHGEADKDIHGIEYDSALEYSLQFLQHVIEERSSVGDIRTFLESDVFPHAGQVIMGSTHPDYGH